MTLQGTGLRGDECAAGDLGQGSPELFGKELMVLWGPVSGIISVKTELCGQEERKHMDISADEIGN